MELAARPATGQRRTEGGQVIVVFALALVAIVGMTGLVLDGGDTFLQRRTLQNAADTAAVAGAYAFTASSSPGDARDWARQTAASNGFVDGAAGVSVDVLVIPGPITSSVTVSVSKPHANTFSGVLGFSSWPVSATATAIAAKPNGVFGLMPVIFNAKVFERYGFGPSTERAFDEPGSGSNDIPITATSFNWTVYCTASGGGCNANSQVVRDLINGHGSTIEVTLGDRINPLNAGAHTTLYSDLVQWVADEFPVAIVNDQGKLLGFAVFHMTGSLGGGSKQIRGYFVTANDPDFRINPDVTGGSSEYGAFIVMLTN